MCQEQIREWLERGYSPMEVNEFSFEREGVGDYGEVWGFYGIVPSLRKPVEQVN